MTITPSSPATTADRLAALQASRGSADRTRLVVPTELRGAPDVATLKNPTIWLFATTVALWTVGWVGYLGGTLPSWAAVAVNAVAAYLGFTVFHESVHRTAHRHRLVNDALGWLPSLMLTFTYPVFRSCHLQHHAHTNDPDLDPDLWVANRPGWLRPIWLVGTAVHYRRLYVRHQWGTPAARRAQFALDAVLVLSLPIALVTGYVAEVWVLYWAPTLVAGLFMFYAFDYLPHHPHTSTERYHDTRIQPGRIRHALLLAQNYHLIHHLWVSVPWFRYRTAFTHVEDGLRAKGATIDG
jgi:beta-carotene hydroxylase